MLILKKLSTNRRIALITTLMITFSILLFGIIINTTYFFGWYNNLLSETNISISEDLVYSSDVDDYYSAIEKGDYEAWKKFASEDMLSIISTKEKFDRMVEMEHLYDIGDEDSAEEIEIELFPDDNYNNEFIDEDYDEEDYNKEDFTEDDYDEVIENGSYKYWQENASDELLDIIDTKDKFKKLLRMEDLYSEGEIEDGEEIEQSLFGDSYVQDYYIDRGQKILEDVFNLYTKEELLDPFLFLQSIAFYKDEINFDTLEKHSFIEGIIKYNNEWYMYQEFGESDESVMLTYATREIERQMQFVRQTIYISIFAAILSYFLSLLFINFMLRDINTLSIHIKNIDIDNLDKKINIPHLPKNDQIQNIANGINDMKYTLKKQVNHITSFISNVSHEFKTPLTIIKNESQVAKISNNSDEHLDSIIETVDNMNDLLDSLLVITRCKKTVLEKEDINLKDLVDNISKQLDSKYKEKNIELKNNIETGSIIHSQKGSLESILTNLIENSYKYIGVKGVIYVYFKGNKLIIKDDGPGMSQEDLDNMWEAFWQKDSSKEIDKGFGLGLYIVKELVELINAKIEVESDETGLKYTIYLS